MSTSSTTLDIWLARSMSGLLGTAGIAHFAAPCYFQSLIPDGVASRDRAKHHLVALSGAADLAAAMLISRRRSRRSGGLAAAALIATYMTSHVEPLLRPRPERGWLFGRSGAIVRIIVNVGYLAVAVRTLRTNEARAGNRQAGGCAEGPGDTLLPAC